LGAEAIVVVSGPEVLPFGLTTNSRVKTVWSEQDAN